MPLIKKSDHKFTYAEYLTWPDEERWELIDGEAWDMPPAPSTRHQGAVTRLAGLLHRALAGGPCRAFVSPVDVVLSERDVLQPDVVVVCDPSKITEANVQGAPDVVIEVLSPSTALKDKREKFRLCERAGVSEYVLVDPSTETVERYVLGAEGLYRRAQVAGREDWLVLPSLNGLELELGEVFR